MNKQQLQQEIAELQKRLEEKQKALSAMPDKWEPEGGEFYIWANCSIERGHSDPDYRAFGTEYATREQAEKAAKAMRAHNRLLAYVAEFAPDYEPDWMKLEPKYYIYFLHSENCFVVGRAAQCQEFGVSYMPKEVADELRDKLNSGEVEL